MADIIITMQEAGDVPVSFRIPASVAAKMDAHVAQLQQSAVLGYPNLNGKAEWFAKECYYKILKPILDGNPDPPPQQALDLLAQIEALKAQVAAIFAQAAVQPIEILPPPAG